MAFAALKEADLVQMEPPLKPDLPCACREDLTGRDESKVLKVLNSMIPTFLGLIASEAEFEESKGRHLWRVAFYCHGICSKTTRKTKSREHISPKCKEGGNLFNELANHVPRGAIFKGSKDMRHVRTGSKPALKLVSEADARDYGLHKVKKVDRFRNRDPFYLAKSDDPSAKAIFALAEYQTTCRRCLPSSQAEGDGL